VLVKGFLGARVSEAFLTSRDGLPEK
jgi:hypothetical protein